MTARKTSTPPRTRKTAEPRTPALIFSFKGRKAKKTQPLLFGVETDGGLETFLAQPTASGYTLLEFMRDGSDEKDPIKASASVLAFFQEVIVPGDLDRFQKAMRNPTIEIEDLVQIAGGLVEEYAEDPT